MAREIHIVKINFFSFQEGADILSHRAGTDEREIAAEEEEKLGSKVYALNSLRHLFTRSLMPAL